MRHETFKDAAVADAFDAIEGSILPSLTMLVERATGAERGMDAAARADELRALAEQLEALTSLLETSRAPRQAAPNPFSTDA